MSLYVKWFCGFEGGAEIEGGIDLYQDIWHRDGGSFAAEIIEDADGSPTIIARTGRFCIKTFPSLDNDVQFLGNYSRWVGEANPGAGVGSTMVVNYHFAFQYTSYGSAPDADDEVKVCRFSPIRQPSNGNAYLGIIFRAASASTTTDLTVELVRYGNTGGVALELIAHPTVISANDGNWHVVVVRVDVGDGDSPNLRTLSLFLDGVQAPTTSSRGVTAEPLYERITILAAGPDKGESPQIYWDDLAVIEWDGTSGDNIDLLAGVALTSNSTTNSPATLTDSSEAWATNQWVGKVVTSGGKTFTVASNTDTVLTGTGAWDDSDPGAGAYTIPADSNYGGWDAYGEILYQPIRDIGTQTDFTGSPNTGEKYQNLDDQNEAAECVSAGDDATSTGAGDDQWAEYAKEKVGGIEAVRQRSQGGNPEGWSDNSGGTPTEINIPPTHGTSDSTGTNILTHSGAFALIHPLNLRVTSGGQTLDISSYTDDVLTGAGGWSGGGTGPGAGTYTLSFTAGYTSNSIGVHMQTDPTTGNAAWTTDKFNAYEGGMRGVATETVETMFLTAWGYNLVRPRKNRCIKPSPALGSSNAGIY